MNDNEIIARWVGWMPGETCCYHPDRDILRWHGADALLNKIEEAGLRERFLTNWFVEWADRAGSGDDYSWDLLNATPAQLSAALVAAIKEVEDDAKTLNH